MKTQNQKIVGGFPVADKPQYPEVTDFLKSIQLEKYVKSFITNGIEDLETILELNDTYLDQMQIPMGYKLKILKKIKTIRQESGMSLPESRQSQSRPGTATSSVLGRETP